MARRRVVAKREALPDPKHGSPLMAKFINHIMVDGKKSIAERIVYGALDTLTVNLKAKGADKSQEDGDTDGGKTGVGTPVTLLSDVLDKVRPTVEVRSRRVGGATYQIPVEVSAQRGTALGMRWLVESAKKRSEKTMALRLAGEFGDVLLGKGNALKKREDTHRMAKANQAFAHYRWN